MTVYTLHLTRPTGYPPPTFATMDDAHEHLSDRTRDQYLGVPWHWKWDGGAYGWRPEPDDGKYRQGWIDRAILRAVDVIGGGR